MRSTGAASGRSCRLYDTHKPLKPLPGPIPGYDHADAGKPDEEKAENKLVDVSYLREKLNVCIPKGHELANEKELSMAQLNGFNCPLTDPEADVTYYLICRKEKEELIRNYR